ncbi:MAG: hypothetical protein IJ468_00890 [Lachnospiraceae bacterium]|nr:hypothetical protein [Lachnospiraceae bacterium]
MIELSIGTPNGVIDQNIYGQFIEHILTCINGGIYDPCSPLADETGIRADVLEKMKELAPPVLRFPGGTIMCQYHWEDAIGPMEKRIRRKNLIWGSELDPSFGTAEFVTFCRRIGAEPMICVNMASGTAEEAGNWVEYCNGTRNTYYANLRRSHGYEEPFQVKYWCIGNESYAEPDIGIHHDVSLYIRDAMEFIKFMKLTDKTIQTVIVGCDREDWNRPVLDALHPVTDYFSYHHYSGEGNMGLYGPFAGERNLKETLARLTALLQTYPEQVTDFSPWYRFPPRSGKIRIALDEWNIWNFVPDETYGLLQTYNWRDALWTASILNLLLSTPEIGMANLAQSVNVIAPIVAETDGSWFQTIAFPLRLYRTAMTGTRLSVSFRSQNPVIDGKAAGQVEALNVSAVQNPDGTVRLAVVNRDFDHDYEIAVTEDARNQNQSGDPDTAAKQTASPDCSFNPNLFQGKTGELTVLTGSAPDAVCSRNHSCVSETHALIDGNTIRIPAGSISLITWR